MLTEEETTDPQLRDYLRLLQRRKWTIMFSALLVAAVALGSSLLQTPIYAGTAKILLQPRSTDTLFNPNTGQRADPVRSVDTEIEVLKSQPVQDAVRQQLGRAPAVSANAVGQTDVIRVVAESPKPQQAAKVANAYANAYVDFRRKQAVDDLLAASEQIQAKVANLQNQIDALDAQIAKAPPDQQAAVRANLGPQKDTLLQQQSVVKQRLDQVQLNADLTSGRGQLVGSAPVPKSPIKPTTKRNVVLALIVGLMLGVGVAFLREHLDDSIKTKDDLDKATPGLPVIGLIPAVTGWKDKDRPQVVSLLDSRSPASEAYRTLRASIQFLTLDKTVRIIQMTSPGAQEGKTTTLANLGVALASAGRRVAIVDCDLRRPRMHSFFGLSNAVGLTSVLVGESPLATALQEVPKQPRLFLLASGRLPPNPAELLSSKRTAEVLDALAGQVDFVLIDTPPLLPVSDALVVSGRADATLLTCYAGGTTRKEVTRAVELLRQVDAPLIGTILNGVTADGPYGYYYYYSSQGNGAKANDPKAAGLKAVGAKKPWRRTKETAP